MSNTYKKGMIRPVGILAFVVVVGILLACFYWLAPYLIKQTVERVGTQLNGAKVELADVDVSLSPAGLYFYGLEVTDARQPMQNLFEIAQARAELDLFQLWSGKVLVDDLTISSLQFSTPRRYSGAIVKTEGSGVSKQEISKAVSDQFQELGGELPDADSVLEKNPLQTTQLATQLDATFKAQKDKWQSISSELPDDARLDYYEQELKALTEGDIKSLDDFNKRKQKFDTLKEEIRKDKARLQEAKEQLSNSKQLVLQGYQDLKNAPQKDWDAISKKYSLDAQGGLNLTGLLFGDRFQSYAETALYWYQRIGPMLEPKAEEQNAQQKAIEPARGEGRFVHFGAQKSQPDVFIRQAKADAVLSQGTVAIEGRDITHQQYLSGKPTVFTAVASDLNDADALNMRLSLDHRSSDSLDAFSIKIEGQNIDDMVLSESANLPLSMNGAKMNLRSSIELKGEQLSGELKSQFANAAFVAGGESTLARELGNALKQVNRFSLDADIGGTIASPDFGIRSDLDRALKNALTGRFKEKQKEWEAKVKSKLNDKLNSYLAKNEELAGYFADQGALLDGDLSKIDELLEQKLNDYVDAQKQEVKDKAKGKLQEKLKGLF